MALNSSTRFNAFQRAGFVLALSASQSFGDGVYPQNLFPGCSLQRLLLRDPNVSNCRRLVVAWLWPWMVCGRFPVKVA
jgi:hypothetical protein